MSELREVAEQIWASVEYGAPATAERQIEKMIAEAREVALREAEETVRPNYTFLTPPVKATARANWALHHAADRIAALRSGTADTNPKDPE